MEWIDVTAETPKQSGTYWVCFEDKGKFYTGLANYQKSFKDWMDDNSNLVQVIYWINLPKVPNHLYS